MLPICYSLSQEYILEELAHHLQRIVIFQRMRCPQQSSFQLYSWGNGDKWGSNLPKYTQLLSGESEIAQLCPTLCDPWTIAHQAPLSMGFSRQEYWSGLPFPSPALVKQLTIRLKFIIFPIQSIFTKFPIEFSSNTHLPYLKYIFSLISRRTYT